MARLYRELAESLPEEAFDQELPVPSNTIGAQLWCVVGGRESYAAAIASDEWTGFRCSLPADATGDRGRVLALDTAGQAVEAAIAGVDEWTEEHDRLLLALLEHEAQHQGQLIRYGYGLPFTFPHGWRVRWSL